MANQNLVTITRIIPECIAVNLLEKKIPSLQNKFNKWDAKLDMSMSIVGYREYTMRDGKGSYVKTNLRSAEITITAETLRMPEYDFLAVIEHTDKVGENIVLTYDNVVADAAWYTMKSRCDHCGENRFRRQTWVIRHKTNSEVKFVGSSCLHEYSGVNPALLLDALNIQAMLDECKVVYNKGVMEQEKAYPYMTALALACDIISGDDSRSFYVWNRLPHALANGTTPSPDGIENAQCLMAWLDKQCKDYLSADQSTVITAEVNLNKYLAHEQKDLMDSGWMTVKYSNNILSLTEVYFRWLALAKIRARRAAEAAKKAAEEATAKQAEEAAKAQGSKYQGKVGEELIIKVESFTRVGSYTHQTYGTTYIFEVKDAKGNVYIWMTGSTREPLKAQVIRAKVKDHREYQGTKQTHISYVKDITPKAC